ncbi:MAG: LysR family transcriptional regulator [Rhodobacteraceae bacterium]|nr:LysR family transcriptional regulator [Paracoccaceae bacterium]
MPRNLDMTALRAFVAVAEAGGVTRAAGHLNLTQSAVSMQLKRLEDNLGRRLFNRIGRQLVLTADGEQMLGYGRRLLALNDEVYARLTDQAFEGEIVFGVPADIVYPHIPGILQRFAAEYPRVRVQLISSFTNQLKRMFGRGECDLILTTEEGIAAGAETLARGRMVWIGAPGGKCWQARPLRLAFETGSLFRAEVEAALDQAGIRWEIAVESESSRTVEATVSADLAVQALIAGTQTGHMEVIDHAGQLPPLGDMLINLYLAPVAQSPLAHPLAALVRQAYRVG